MKVLMPMLLMAMPFGLNFSPLATVAFLAVVVIVGWMYLGNELRFQPVLLGLGTCARKLIPDPSPEDIVLRALSSRFEQAEVRILNAHPENLTFTCDAAESSEMIEDAIASMMILFGYIRCDSVELCRRQETDKVFSLSVQRQGPAFDEEHLIYLSIG